MISDVSRCPPTPTRVVVISDRACLSVSWFPVNSLPLGWVATHADGVGPWLAVTLVFCSLDYIYFVSSFGFVIVITLLMEDLRVLKLNKINNGDVP